jgi:hypothetical protein
MWTSRRSHIHPLALLLLLLLTVAACNTTGGMPEITQTGIFVQSRGELVEMRRLGTLGNTYGPRLYPELADDSIAVVPDVGPIYVNIPDLAAASLKGIEWHGYRLGGNGSVGSRSTATPQEWKIVPITTEPTKVAGVFKVVITAADAKSGRWKPEINHEYFGLTVDDGYKATPIWAVKIK